MTNPLRALVNGTNWPDPIPLGDGSTPPPFPVHVLPDWMATYVNAVAHEMQVAPDLPAILGLVGLSIATGPHYRIRIDTNWHERLNIYAVVSLPPSAGKSPVLKKMLGVVFDHEATLRLDAQQRMAHVEQKRRMAEKAMKRAEDKGDINEAQRCLDDLLNTPMPVVPRLIANDATPEAIAQLLSEQGERLALVSTEGGPFEIMAGRYSDKANIEVYLQGWSGDPFTVDRMNRPAVTLTAPTLTVGLTVQPRVIEALAAKDDFRGRGLLDRFMYSLPEDNVGMRNLLEVRTTDAALSDRYDGWLRELLEREVPTVPETIVLDAQAHELFGQWRQGHEDRMTPDGDLRPMASWVVKMQSTTVRVAGMLAAVDGRQTVDAEGLLRAIEVGDYWLQHAKLVHDVWSSDDRLTAARAILKWAVDRRLDEFSVRDVYASLRKLFPSAEDSKAPLELLVERGWLVSQSDEALVIGRRGKESHRFWVHPKALTQKDAHARHVSHVLRKPFLSSSSSSVPDPSFLRDTAHDAHDTHDAHDDSGLF